MKLLTVIITVCLCMIVCAGVMAGNRDADTDYNHQNHYQGDILPRWMTLEERTREQPLIDELDELTPPPDNPVSLDAEFDYQDGIILRYPFSLTDMFVLMVDEFQEVATVYILVGSLGLENQCNSLLVANGVPTENVEYIQCQTDAIWARDFGPWFVEDEGSLSVVDLIYYWTRPNDDYIPEFLHDYWDLGYYGPDIHHEGGNMMTDGHGSMFMSTRVLDANPGMTELEVSDIYHDYFGQDNTYIFQRISLDGTGHIDLWAKVMNDTTILVAQMQPGDVNYNLVESHAAEMATLPTVTGGTFNIVRCPMPPVDYDWIYGYWYRSYLNSKLLNNKAVIPIYGLEWDDEAIAAYQEALGPDWEVVGIDCNDIAPWGGAIHCVTMGVPEFPPEILTINATPVNPPILIQAWGGSFQWDVVIENIWEEAYTFDAWTSVILPNGNDYGPLDLYLNLTLPPGESLTPATLTQSVPSGAPNGWYTYIANVGQYPQPEAFSEFDFAKLPIDQPEMFDIADNTGWTLAGWDDDSETEMFNTSTIPFDFVLDDPYPNPFNPSTTIGIGLPHSADLTVKVYNLTGREVAALADGHYTQGYHHLTFDAAGMATGVYFIQAIVPGRITEIRKVVLMK